MKSTNTDDIIRFTHDNTSLLELVVNLPSSDTALGIVTGNHGPVNLESLFSTIHIDSLEAWNINNYFYNDDQSLYEVNETGFSIVDDSLMVYAGSQSGTFNFDINALDDFDPLLSDIMSSEVTITNTQYFLLSGTYVDQQLNPIENAQVQYLQFGTTLLEETFADDYGFFELDMIVDPDDSKSNDVLRFTKDNTSIKEIAFNTPSQDTVVDVSGNLGPMALSNISDTLFTINPYRAWNLNDYFTNDDQSEYSINSPAFVIMDDSTLVFIQMEEGIYEATVTATDTADNSLQAIVTAEMDVQYTLSIPDFEIIEDTESDTLIADITLFNNPIYPNPLTYEIISQSNEALITLALENNSALIDYLQPDGFGLSTIGMKAMDEEFSDTVYFDVSVLSRPDIFGNIIDFFDSTSVSFAVVEIEEDGFTHIDTCNAQGEYHIQLIDDVNSTTYLPVTIRNENFTPFHSWATIEPGGANLTKDFTLIYNDFHWVLYNDAFRTNPNGNIPGYGISTMQWAIPPDIPVFSDSSFVTIPSLELFVNTCLFNILNILPTFNERDVVEENVFVEPINYPTQDGQMSVKWWSGVGGGAWSYYSIGPILIQASVIFGQTVASYPDNCVYNQEIGSAMGATHEPTYPNVADESVFAGNTNIATYSTYDLECGAVHIRRSMIHYQNEDYNEDDPEGFDWELRPDLVDQYYPPDGSKSKLPLKKMFHYKVMNEKGHLTERGSYPYDSIPKRVKELFPLEFPNINDDIW